MAWQLDFAMYPADGFVATEARLCRIVLHRLVNIWGATMGNGGGILRHCASKL